MLPSIHCANMHYVREYPQCLTSAFVALHTGGGTRLDEAHSGMPGAGDRSAHASVRPSCTCSTGTHCNTHSERPLCVCVSTFPCAHKTSASSRASERENTNAYAPSSYSPHERSHTLTHDELELEQPRITGGHANTNRQIYIYIYKWCARVHNAATIS